MSPTLVVSEASAIIGAASRAPVIPMATVPINSLRLDFSPPMSDPLLSIYPRIRACRSGDVLIADNVKAMAGTPPLQESRTGPTPPVSRPRRHDITKVPPFERPPTRGQREHRKLGRGDPCRTVLVRASR